MAEKTDRRTVLKTVAAVVGGLAVGGAAGWLSKPAVEVPGRTVTETLAAATVTETATVTPAAEKPKWRMVWAWGVNWFTGYIPSMIGANTAAKLLNMELSWEGTKPYPATPEYTDFIMSKLAGLDPKRDCIVVHYNNLIADACKEAMDRGIGVFSSNIDDYTQPLEKRMRLAVVAQSHYNAGRANAMYLIQKGLLKKGDRALISCQARGVGDLEVRFQGTYDALKELGCIIDDLAYGYDPSKVASMYEAYYYGHPDVKAIFGQDGAAAVGMQAFQTSAGLEPGELPNVVWDPTDVAIKGIRDGYITGANDQEFYFQGFYPMVQAWLWKNDLTHFMAPPDIDTIRGTIVDKANVDTYEQFVKVCNDEQAKLGWFRPA